MIVRHARIREITHRVLEDGSESHSALVSCDEAAATTIRLTAEEFATLGAVLGAGRRLVMTLRIGPPDLNELAFRNVVKP